MNSSLEKKIIKNKNFKYLVKKKSFISWFLSSITLLLYFSFILLIAFFPEILGIKISEKSIITIGIPIGVTIILLAFISTGFYVLIANKELDQIEKKILKKYK
tara:strand:+ start:11952 stop:12260 length:309 start_codon:yes stop_codon:yes gene_type:complete